MIEKNAWRSGAGSARLPRFGKMSMLMAPEGDPPPGGAGGTGGLTQAAIDQMNAAIKAQLQRFDVGPMVKSALEAALPDLVKSITGEVAKTVKPPEPAPGDKGKKPEGGAGAANVPEEVRNMLAQQQAAIDKLTETAKQKDEALRVAHARERDQTVTGKLKAALDSKKIRPELMEGAMAVLKGKAEVKWTDEGPLVKVKRNAPGVGAYTEEIPLEAYADEWTKTDEGKGYLPAPTGRGSGAGAPRGQAPAFVAGGGQGQGQQQPQNGQRAAAQGPSDVELGNLMFAAYNGAGDE